MKIIVILSLFISNLFFSQIVVPNDYKKIPDILDTVDYLYPFIIPGKEYQYWRVLSNINDPDKAVIYESQMPDPMTINEPFPTKGFFQKCVGEGCFSYILACKEDRSVYFSNEQQLKDFIGSVDNLPEALLIARINGFWIDTKNRFTGSYKIEDKYISLYGLKSKDCPVTKESFLIKINRRTGKLEAKSNGIYYKSDECITQ